MFEAIRSAKGKLLFKWDSKNRILQIKQGDEIATLQISRTGRIEAVALQNTVLDASADTK